MINLELRKYIECTPEEKKPLLKIIAGIVNLANICRREGVLALEQQIEKTDDKLTKIGLGLICGGTDPKLVEGILSTFIVTSNKTGADLLSQLIVQDGLLQIQAGHNPRIIEEKLLAYMGDIDTNDHSIYSERFVDGEYNALMADIANWEKTTGLPGFEMLVNFSDRDIQHVLREVDTNILAIALRDASFELKNRVLQNLSKRLCIDIINDMKIMGPIIPEDIAEAQREIVKTLYRLQEMGEIITPKEQSNV